MKIIRLESADSTNNWVAQNEMELPSPAMVFCENQYAGRGQKGNSWESEPGKNITASLLFHPDDFPACSQFAISEAISLAISEFLRHKGVDAKIKWPNDIYVGDRKICGILVEHSVYGKTISRSIAGFGININQEIFISDAPNPVSLSQLTLKKYDIKEEIKALANYLEKNLAKIYTPEELHSEFLLNLWRKDEGYHDFFDRKASQHIKARIYSVAPDGILTLETSEGEKREFAFKEVEFIISKNSDAGDTGKIA